MIFSMKSTEPQRQIESQHPFTAGGGLTGRPTTERDPYEALDDLMTVVEALCPRWPPRENFRDSDRFLL